MAQLFVRQALRCCWLASAIACTLVGAISPVLATNLFKDSMTGTSPLKPRMLLSDAQSWGFVVLLLLLALLFAYFYLVTTEDENEEKWRQHKRRTEKGGSPALSGDSYEQPLLDDSAPYEEVGV